MLTKQLGSKIRIAVAGLTALPACCAQSNEFVQTGSVTALAEVADQGADLPLQGPAGPNFLVDSNASVIGQVVLRYSDKVIVELCGVGALVWIGVPTGKPQVSSPLGEFWAATDSKCQEPAAFGAANYVHTLFSPKEWYWSDRYATFFEPVTVPRDITLIADTNPWAFGGGCDVYGQPHEFKGAYGIRKVDKIIPLPKGPVHIVSGGAGCL